MLIEKPLRFVKNFIDDLDSSLRKYNENAGLSLTQRTWLAFCLTAIIVTETVCWKKFERASLGKHTTAALSWMFRNSKIFWEKMFQTSVKMILKKYGIKEGVLIADDTEKKRSKSTKRIFGVHKIKDKASSGYIKGQSIIFLVFVTPLVTIPVGFKFYIPDPEIKKWKKNEKKLKAQKVPKKERPLKPERNHNYPIKQEIVLNLLTEFKCNNPIVKVRLIAVDGLYSDTKFMDAASNIFKGIQVISRARKNQNIRFRSKKMNIKSYFNTRPGAVHKVNIRGKEKEVIVNSARLHVDSHKKKRFVIALKYEEDSEYRYLIANDLSWRTLDIIEGYTYRWLVEVFIQDWKANEGWGRLTKQPDEEGSSRGLILSLLLDHCLLFHSDQNAQIENKLPAYTVGSLQEKAKIECLLNFIQNVVTKENPKENIAHITKALKEIFKLKLSKKHMVNQDFGKLGPSPSLKNKFKNAA